MAEEREVWILRHAEAEASTGPDGERRLTAAGEETARAVGARLAALGLRPTRILTSPLARARRTAELVAAATAGRDGTRCPVERCDFLRPGEDTMEAWHEATTDLLLPALLVGHNPDLERLVHSLSGEVIPLGTAALVRLALGEGKPRVVERPR